MRIFFPVSYDFWLMQIHWDNLWDTLNLVGTSHDTGTVVTVTPTALPPHHLIMSDYHRPGIMAADHSGITKMNTSVHWSMASLKENVVKP